MKGGSGEKGTSLAFDKDKKETIGRGSARERGKSFRIFLYRTEYRLLFVNRLIAFDLKDRLISFIFLCAYLIGYVVDFIDSVYFCHVGRIYMLFNRWNKIIFFFFFFEKINIIIYRDRNIITYNLFVITCYRFNYLTIK